MSLLIVPDFLTPRQVGPLRAIYGAALTARRFSPRGTLVTDVALSAVTVDPLYLGLADRVAVLLRTHYPALPSLALDYAAYTRMRPGGRHTLHADGVKLDGSPNHTPNRVASAMLYLNGGFTGGVIRFPKLGQEIAPQPGVLVGFLTDLDHQHEVTEVQGGDRDAIAFWFQHADPAQRATPDTPDTPERKRAIALAVARCPDLGDRLPNQPCGGSLHRCNRFGDKTSRVGRCADENRACADCSHHPANAPVRAPAPVVLNMGAGGLGDAIQGLLVAGAVKRENPGARVVYKVNPLRFGFVELFHGYDELAPHDWDGGAARDLPGPDRQLNAGFWQAETPTGPPRIERYLANAGARGPAEPIRLKDPDRLAALGARWAGCVALCPISAGSDREWNIPAWLTLERLLHAAGYRTVVLHSEHRRVEPFAGEKLIGASPEQVVGCLRNCAAAVGVDSGLSHLAAAVGTPTVVLCGQTDGAKVFGCYPSARGLSGPLACSGCYWQGAVWSKERCRPQCPSIQGIQPAQVFAAVAEIAPPTDPVRARLAGLRRALAAPPPYPGGTGPGIVTAGEGRYWPMLVAMLRTLRDTGCALPVEVWYRGAAGAVRPSDVADLDVTLIDADARARQFGDNRVPQGDPDTGGWEGKLYALAHTRFETAVWIDADAVPLADPSVLADLADAHGLVMWADRSEEAARHLRWDEVWPDGPGNVPPVSAGQFAINRRRAWPALAAAYEICQRSDYYFARMLGDNDAWRVALAATGQPWRELGELVKLPGVKHLFRFDLDGAPGGSGGNIPPPSPLFLHRSGPKLIPIEGHAGVDARHVAHFAAALAPADEAAELRRVARHSLVSPDRLRVIRDRVIATNHLPGALAEVGVYRGGTARLIGAFAPGAALHLFDTFAGIPEDDAAGGDHKAGDLAAALDEARANVDNPAAVYHVGRFPDALPPEGTRFRFVHIDCDTFQAVRDALAYFWPRLVPGGALVLDDLDWPACPGVRSALEEVPHGAAVEVLVPFQGVLRKP